MSFGIIALLAAGLGAGWLLLRLARGGGEAMRNITLMKFVVWFGLAAALFAAKLWPLAFMVLVAVGGVMAIETWRGKQIEGEAGERITPPAKSMTHAEALSVLGVSTEANVGDVKAAHKKLIAQIHPDKGGTDYLAAKINEARDLLLAGLSENDKHSD